MTTHCFPEIETLARQLLSGDVAGFTVNDRGLVVHPDVPGWWFFGGTYPRCANDWTDVNRSNWVRVHEDVNPAPMESLKGLCFKIGSDGAESWCHVLWHGSGLCAYCGCPMEGWCCDMCGAS